MAGRFGLSTEAWDPRRRTDRQGFSEILGFSVAEPLKQVYHYMSEDRLQPDPVIEAYKHDIDRSLLRQNLQLTVEERFLKLMELQRFAAELRQAGQRAGQ